MVVKKSSTQQSNEAEWQPWFTDVPGDIFNECMRQWRTYSVQKKRISWPFVGEINFQRKPQYREKWRLGRGCLATLVFAYASLRHVHRETPPLVEMIEKGSAEFLWRSFPGNVNRFLFPTSRSNEWPNAAPFNGRTTGCQRLSESTKSFNGRWWWFSWFVCLEWFILRKRSEKYKSKQNRIVPKSFLCRFRFRFGWFDYPHTLVRHSRR